MKPPATKKRRLRPRTGNSAGENLSARVVRTLGLCFCVLDGVGRLEGHTNNTFGAVATAAATTATSTTAASFRDKELPIATVYDDVLPPATAEWLHELCSDWNEGTKAHNAKSTTQHDENNNILNPNPKDLVFEFPLKKTQQHTPLQRFLNDLIWQMVLKEEETDNDDHERSTENTTPTSPRFYVEYWTRQQWHHILAHQDMDEGWERLLRKQRHECLERQKQHAEQSSEDDKCLETIQQQKFKHPFAGQVLYLKVGTKVRGPTVVFDAANGGDLAQSPNQNNSTTTTTMVSVPAVAGRLLRFPGDRLHAVPRPHDVYWTFDQSRNSLHTPDYLRSVLLFNLWDPSTLPEDKLLDCGDGIFRSDRTTCLADEQPPTGPEANAKDSDETCNPRTTWKSIPLLHRKGFPDPPDEEQPQEATPSLLSLLWEWLVGGGDQLRHEFFQIPLLGDAYKRGMFGYVARMKSFTWWADGDDETSTTTATASSGGRMVHPARDNLGEALLPTSTEAEADERFVVERSGSGEL